jgi:hypothetical protein
MNREDIVHMAREAGWTQYSLLYPVEVQRLEHFAELVADAEREECALIIQRAGLSSIATAIRARGK